MRRLWINGRGDDSQKSGRDGVQRAAQEKREADDQERQRVMGASTVAAVIGSVRNAKFLPIETGGSWIAGMEKKREAEHYEPITEPRRSGPAGESA